MSEGQRPGGLTALAVIHFVLSAFSALGVVGLVFLILMPELVDEASREGMPPESALPLLAANSILETILLFLSGLGFLWQKKVLGRYVATAYGVISIIANGVVIAMMPTIQLSNFVGLVYPLLVLYFVNVTFKDDLVR